MTLLADWLQTLGAATLGTLWVPLLAWTAVALAVMSLLRLWRSAHTLVHYHPDGAAAGAAVGPPPRRCHRPLDPGPLSEP